MPRSPSGASARPSPRVLIKSLELNALHTSRIRDMVRLNGNRSSVSFDRFTLPGQFARIGVAFDQEKTATDFWTYSEYAALVGYYAELPYGVTVYPEVSYAARDYSGIFPFMTGPRQDRRWSASLSLTKRDLLIFGFAPRLIYTYTANYSNVGLYAYDKHSVISLLTRAF